MIGREVGSKFCPRGYHCTNIGKMHTWPFTTPCGFNERYVVENKDRFLEGAEFTDEWESFMHNKGIDKQRKSSIAREKTMIPPRCFYLGST